MTIAEQQIYYWAHMLDPIDESKKCCEKEKCKGKDCKGKDCTDECNETFEMPTDEMDVSDEAQLLTDAPQTKNQTTTSECDETEEDTFECNETIKDEDECENTQFNEASGNIKTNDKCDFNANEEWKKCLKKHNGNVKDAKAEWRKEVDPESDGSKSTEKTRNVAKQCREMNKMLDDAINANETEEDIQEKECCGDECDETEEDTFECQNLDCNETDTDMFEDMMAESMKHFKCR